MGHSTITMTFDRYGHLMLGSRDEIRERVDAYLERSATVERAHQWAHEAPQEAEHPLDERVPGVPLRGFEPRFPD